MQPGRGKQGKAKIYFNPSLPRYYIEGLVQDCSHSSALAMELLQSSTKPSINLRCKTSAAGDFLEAIRHIRQNCV